mgnify:CR=1 FL=1
MQIFGWMAKGTTIPSMKASCTIHETSFLATVCDASSDGMVCTVPSCRISSSLMDLIGSPLRIVIDGTIIEGVLSYYTIEESLYRIGISVDRRYRGSWRRICAERVAQQGFATARDHAHA